MNSTIIDVTPAQARTWLDNQLPNRPISRALVRQLKRAIEEGRWLLTHQGIALDDDGVLVDGQHRLTAIVETGRPVRIMVTFGVSREVTIKAVDQGNRRSMAQLAGMKGETCATAKASIARTLAVAVLGIHISDRFDPAGATTGVGLAEGDPRLQLRHTMALSRGRSGGAQQTPDHLLRAVSALHAFLSGDQIKRLQISATRYREFCSMAKIPVSPHLLSFAESASGH